MSDNEETNSHTGFDSIDHQPAYVYVPGSIHDHAPERAPKRRKVSKSKVTTSRTQEQPKSSGFESLLGGVESPECVQLRHELYQKCWTETDARIQLLLDEANEDTLEEVTSFVNNPKEAEDDKRVPACFIVTGPNIASQSTLFQQLSGRLKTEIDGPVVTLRSGDAMNLKAVLKQLIRDATNQRSEDDELSNEQDGRKLLNYDLEILHNFVRTHKSKKVVVAFQDSEAFDTNLILDITTLFSSWMDRIPFVVLFGVATSVELFQERLPKTASRYLYGIQVYVEQTSSIIEKVFRKAVASPRAPLILGFTLVSTLMERQHDHVQSVQSFVAALKYVYMCHFYGNALSILNTMSGTTAALVKLMLPSHYEAIRTLPSFRILVHNLVKTNEFSRARNLFKDDGILGQEIEHALKLKDAKIIRLLRALHVLENSATEPIGVIDLYLTIFKGGFRDSDYLKSILDSIKRMAPDDLSAFTKRVRSAVETGSSETDLEGWSDVDHEFLAEIQDIETKVESMLEDANATGKPIRSSYAIHNKGLRTTVISQRVQLSYENSTLTEAEKEYTGIIDRLSNRLEEYFDLETPKDLFLNETWLCDKTTSLLEVFAPRPRAAIEDALSCPHDYLPQNDSLQQSSIQQATAILYQRYLEAGSLINMADMWSSFYEILAENESEEYDEREALMQFYRGLAELKLLGMVKQSKKKADHLTKISWKGL
ncbi:hypothetical protein G7Y89_g12957 [Cudoniella acicularis]|uniref:Origin recognition complex subunit 3 n=1 Tax=Cudoniella acicularis TaxID=354080 RepID=A0A8H4RAG5_9HELO|nr:hypothetical protein G7Y89_g12957 [Cudoniella acicularis]